jgi:hypothetical protein
LADVISLKAAVRKSVDTTFHIYRFYVWVVCKGEGGERENVHARVWSEVSSQKEFPEFDHLLEL